MATRNAIRRREFISTTAIAVVAGTTSLASAASKTSIDVKSVTSATFKKFVGQKFTYGSSNATLTLESVDVFADPNGKKRPKNVRPECFSLILSAPAGVKLASGSYTLANANVTSFSVYIGKVAMPGSTTTRSTKKKGLASVAGQYLAGVATSAAATKSYYEAAFS